MAYQLPEYPDTAAAMAALSVARRFCSPALLNHSLRSYVWGDLYARAHGIAFDDELYFVSALLHDTGLTEPFDSHRLSFEETGGCVAWVVAVTSAWSADRAMRAEQIIIAHMRDDVTAAGDPESHMLQVATSWDVSGRRSEEFAEADRRIVLDRYPRLGFGPEFVRAFEDQAGRKPNGAAAEAIESGIATRVSANPLDR